MKWASTRHALRAKFPLASYEARTDVALTNLGQPGRIYAILEAKEFPRDVHGPKVQMQEAAQVVVWLKQGHHPSVR